MKVTVRFHPIFEFLTSFYVFSDKGAQKRIDLGTSWVNKVKTTVSEEFLEEVSKKETRIKVVVIQYYLMSQSFDEQVDILELFDQIANEDMKSLITPAYECTEFKDQIPPDVKDIIPLLKEWYDTYFTTVDQQILTNLRASVNKAEELLNVMEAHQVVEKMTNGIIPPKDSSREVILIPQYHYTPTVLHEKTIDQYIYFYPVDAKPVVEGSPSIELMRKIRALSDENRLKILKYLAQGDRTFSDIQKFIGLAKSTAHHHLIVLRSAGLLSLVIFENQQAQYRFRQEGYKGIEQLLNEFFNA
ncbi:ArsR/SmtB family transcription factor [Alkalihalobacterium elongatum]|uniref:ArsR/SmtB family transcription factor n=1 Tax=Alkalihalobacterium elongatum TaxID=2675466 RepID=UPI001C1F35DD|nr:winged helix-turn-helix domain-containing protein [Alkalihalobacterium elongatum]